MSTVARVDINALQFLPPCILGEFINISTPICAQENFTIAPNVTINATEVLEATMDLNLAVTTQQPTGEGGLQRHEYLIIAAVGAIVLVGAIAICALVLICIGQFKIRKRRRAKYTNSRSFTHDRCKLNNQCTNNNFFTDFLSTPITHTHSQNCSSK